MNNVITNYDSTQKTQFEIDLSNLVSAEIGRITHSPDDQSFFPMLCSMMDCAGRLIAATGSADRDIIVFCDVASRRMLSAAEAAHLQIYGEAAK